MTRTTKILVVEDEAPIRRLIAAALSKLDATLDETGSGERAVEMLEADEHDLLILDLMLEDISGWDVLDEIRRRGLRDRVKVMILTAQSAERDILRGWRLGVDSYVMKPFDPLAFVEAVGGVLAASSEELARNRQAELDKTELLHLVDNMFEG